MKAYLEFWYNYLRYKMMIGRAQSQKVDLHKFLSYTLLNKIKNTNKEIFLKAPVVGGGITLRDSEADFDVFRDFYIKNDYVKTIPDAKVVIDAGAHIGCSVLWYATKYPSAQIFAVEANQKNHQQLTKNTQHLKNVMVYQAALSGEANLIMEQEDKRAETLKYSYSYSFKESKSADSGLKSISIPEIMKQNNLTELDVVKIDIEGGEVEVFSKNVDWVKATKQIVVEMHDYKRKGCSKVFWQTFADLNFAIEFSGENLLLTNLDLLPNYFPNAK
jgi:FkbM family methyltransferase